MEMSVTAFKATCTRVFHDIEKQKNCSDHAAREGHSRRAAIERSGAGSKKKIWDACTRPLPSRLTGMTRWEGGLGGM